MAEPLNLLILLADQHRWDWLGSLGEVPVRTPNLDALAGEGVTFTRATCTSPLCAPSRASLATGMRPHRTGVLNNQRDLPTHLPTFMKDLRASGYLVGAVGKTDLHKKTKWYGLQGWTRFCGQIGFTDTVDCAGKWDAMSGAEEPRDPYMAYLHQQGSATDHVADFAVRRAARDDDGHILGTPSALPSDQYCDTWIGRSGRELLASMPSGEPWQLTVNFTGPHEPFDAPAEILERYADVEFPLPSEADRRRLTMTDQQLQEVMRNYAAMIEGIDAQVGAYLQLLRDRGELENTMVVYTSDHGEMLGQHGRWGKGVMYEESVRVPMIVSMPGAGAAGARSDALVEVPDVVATFFEHVFGHVPGNWDTASFSASLTDPQASSRSAQVAVLNDVRMLRTDRYKLIVATDSAELFDLDADPSERENLAERRPDLLRELRERLEAELAAEHLEPEAMPMN